MTAATPRGPLNGRRIIELAGIGPAPYCGQLLADMGADVIVIDRPEGAMAAVAPGAPPPIDMRGKRSVVLDLRKPAAVAAGLRLVGTADILIEGFRPGVAERLGIGPDACLNVNPKLVYGRMTGWGQEGPLAQAAGHDLNYLGLTGFLGMLGPPDAPPPPPLNLVGDYGGGALFLTMGVLAAMSNADRTGKGDVVDAAIIDGVASMLGVVHSLAAYGQWSANRHDNLLDGGAPFYRCYATQDGNYMAVACIEPKFFAAMLDVLGIADADYGGQYAKASWPAQHRLLQATFATKTREAWSTLFDGVDACVTPVLDFGEAAAHPHNKARASHAHVDGVSHPHVAPRFAAHSTGAPLPAATRGADTRAVLESIGLSVAEIDALSD